MKIETSIDENTYWLCLWAIIAISISSFGAYCVYGYTERAKAAFNAGLHEVQMGGASTAWGK